MVIVCQNCQRKVDEVNIKEYNSSNFCEECVIELGYKKMNCKLCGKTGEFKPKGFIHYNRRYECPNCDGNFIPWKLRHFGKKFVGYPKWISEKDWVLNESVILN